MLRVLPPLSNMSCNKSVDKVASRCVDTNVWPKKKLNYAMVTPYPGVTSLVIKQVCIDLDSAGKTRSMCRFCCKKDNVSQPATTWFVTRGFFFSFTKVLRFWRTVCHQTDKWKLKIPSWVEPMIACQQTSPPPFLRKNRFILRGGESVNGLSPVSKSHRLRKICKGRYTRGILLLEHAPGGRSGSKAPPRVPAEFPPRKMLHDI